MRYKNDSLSLDSQEEKPRQKALIMPKIFDADGDMKKKWYVFYSYRDPVTGKMKRFRPQEKINKHKNYADRMEAARKLQKKYYDRLRNGWNPFENDDVVYEDALEYKRIADTYSKMKKGNKRLIMLINEYMDSKKPPVFRKKTYDTYQSKFRVLANWLRQKKKLDIHPAMLNEELLEEFFRFLLDRRKATPGTYNKYRAVFISFFKYAKKKKRVRKCPMHAIPYMKDTARVPIIYNDKMQKAIVDFLERNDKQMLLVVKFIYYTFIRPGELRFMKIGDLDFWESTAIVRAEVSKNRREQKVTIPDVFLEELELLQWGSLDKNLYLFSRSGKPDTTHVGSNYFASRYRKYMEQMGIDKRYELYSWKHTGASVALQTVGVDIESLRKQLRHVDLNDTQRYASAIVNNTSVFRTNYKKI
jgi:integrase